MKFKLGWSEQAILSFDNKKNESKLNWSQALKSSSFWQLLVTNIFTIFLAIIQNWGPGELIWTYFGQSIIIGIYQYKKIKDLKHFSVKGLTIRDRKPEVSQKTKNYLATFFAGHFGLFHILFFVFFSQTPSSLINRQSSIFVLASIFSFFFNHLSSYRQNKNSDQNRAPNIGYMTFFPYLRVVPMHLIVIAAGHFTQNNLNMLAILFLGLKTAADLIMHSVEHFSEPVNINKNKTIENRPTAGENY